MPTKTQIQKNSAHFVHKGFQDKRIRGWGTTESSRFPHKETGNKVMLIRVPRGFFAWIAAATWLFAGNAQASPELVSNGDFESGDFTGWTLFGDQSNNSVDTNSPNTGLNGAYFGPIGTTGGVSQKLVTESGKTYHVDFWLKNEADIFGAFAPNSFDFSWDGVNIMALSNAGAGDYIEYSFQLAAASSSTEIAFTFRNDPAFWDFDSVSVMLAPPGGDVPEPGSLVLVGLAGLVAGLIRRRRIGTKSA